MRPARGEKMSARSGLPMFSFNLKLQKVSSRPLAISCPPCCCLSCWSCSCCRSSCSRSCRPLGGWTKSRLPLTRMIWFLLSFCPWRFLAVSSLTLRAWARSCVLNPEKTLLPFPCCSCCPGRPNGCWCCPGRPCSPCWRGWLWPCWLNSFSGLPAR